MGMLFLKVIKRRGRRTEEQHIIKKNKTLPCCAIYGAENQSQILFSTDLFRNKDDKRNNNFYMGKYFQHDGSSYDDDDDIITVVLYNK